MKRKLIILITLSMISISGCGKPQSKEIESSSQAEENQSISDKDYEIFTEYTDDSPSSVNDNLSESKVQSEEISDSSEKITEGDLYDSIVAIYPNVTLHETAGSLSIQIDMKHESIEIDSIYFFDIVASICQSCNLENYYADISFSMMVDGKFVTMLTLIDYTAPSSFSTTEPFVLKDEYESIINDIYSSVFSKNDISNGFDEYLDSLKDQYENEN